MASKTRGSIKISGNTHVDMRAETLSGLHVPACVQANKNNVELSFEGRKDLISLSKNVPYMHYVTNEHTMA